MMQSRGKKVSSLQQISRRNFLRVGAAAAASIVVPGVAFAGLRVRFAPARSIAFYNLHTGESLKTVYWEKGDYIPEALARIDYLMRDFRANEIRAIHPALLDLLRRIHKRLDTNEPFHLISGYRSPKTNAMLAAQNEGVAPHSLHVKGMAADVRVPGRQLSDLRQAGLRLRGGGVGYYPKSDFVHVDIGRVRYW